MCKKDEEPSEKDSRRISPSVLRILVILYILWIVKELFFGMLKKETADSSIWLLGIAAAVLLMGAAGLVYFEWRDRKNKK